MDVKLVATRHSGAHQVGQHVTDPDHIEEAMGGALRKRYVRTAVHPGDVPFEPVIEAAPEAEEAAPTAAPEAERE